MSFFAKVSDPLIGGTYMTLLNTITNLGHVWIKTFFLWLMDILTWKSCSPTDNFDASNSTLSIENNECNNIITKASCVDNKGVCVTAIDGFFVEVGFGVAFAAVWYYFGCKMIRKLQNMPIKSWHVLSDHVELKNLERVLMESDEKSWLLEEIMKTNKPQLPITITLRVYFFDIKQKPDKALLLFHNWIKSQLHNRDQTIRANKFKRFQTYKNFLFHLERERKTITRQVIYDHLWLSSVGWMDTAAGAICLRWQEIRKYLSFKSISFYCELEQEMRK